MSRQELITMLKRKLAEAEEMGVQLVWEDIDIPVHIGLIQHLLEYLQAEEEKELAS